MDRSPQRYDVLIVGASVAGLAVAERLRRKGFSGSIAMVGAEPHLPYDKPPLSKKILDPAWTPESAQLRTAQQYDVLAVDLRLGVPAAGFDAVSRTVTLADGSRLCGKDVVLATGAKPRALPSSPGTLTVRSLDDAVTLRERLRPGRELVVVGGGFVGAELAAAASRHGVGVTIVEATQYPLSPALGVEVSGALAAAQVRRGVRLACGVPVDRIEASPESDEHVVILADGSRVDTDVVVAGLGVAPSLDWLRGAGLDLGDGVLCDDSGRASSDHVYAAGDVACWQDRLTGERVRTQHWTSAREQGTVVADVLRGSDDPFRLSDAPYFWSDQGDLRVQSYGRFSGRDACRLAWGAYADERFVAHYYRDGRLVGVLGVNAARELGRHRTELVEAAAVGATV